MTMNTTQTTKRKTPEQLERASAIVASFRGVLASYRKPNPQSSKTAIAANNHKVELFRKYPTSNYGERRA